MSKDLTILKGTGSLAVWPGASFIELLNRQLCAYCFKKLLTVSMGKGMLTFQHLKASHTTGIMNMITISTQRECILLVELLCTEYMHAYLTNRGRAFWTFSILFSLSRPVWGFFFTKQMQKVWIKTEKEKKKAENCSLMSMKLVPGLSSWILDHFKVLYWQIKPNRIHHEKDHLIRYMCMRQCNN